MNAGKVILLFAGAMLISQLAAAKKFLKDFSIKFLDSKFDFKKSEAAGFQQLYFFIRAKVSNKTDLVGTLQSAKIEVHYNKTKLGWVDLKNAITIKAGAETFVEIPVKVETFNIIRSLPTLMQLLTENKSLVFHIKGPLNFNVGSYNVDQDIKVPLLQSNV